MSLLVLPFVGVQSYTFSAASTSSIASGCASTSSMASGCAASPTECADHTPAREMCHVPRGHGCHESYSKWSTMQRLLAAGHDRRFAIKHASAWMAAHDGGSIICTASVIDPRLCLRARVCMYSVHARACGLRPRRRPEYRASVVNTPTPLQLLIHACESGGGMPRPHTKLNGSPRSRYALVR
jgi:hypothetical protein